MLRDRASCSGLIGRLPILSIPEQERKAGKIIEESGAADEARDRSLGRRCRKLLGCGPEGPSLYRGSCAGTRSDEKSIDGRRLATGSRNAEIDALRRLSCRQLSQRPPGMFTRPRHPRGWFTQEYIFLKWFVCFRRTGEAGGLAAGGGQVRECSRRRCLSGSEGAGGSVSEDGATAVVRRAGDGGCCCCGGEVGLELYGACCC